MNIYDLAGSKDTVTTLKQIVDLGLEITTLKDLLIKHGVISELEFQSAKEYHASTPDFKKMIDGLNQASATINHYQNNSAEYLKELFNRKLQGKD